jgi:hypothetical protein
MHRGGFVLRRRVKMWLFGARCCGVLRDPGRVHRWDAEDAEGRGGGLPFWRVGSFCISGVMVRVGVVWHGLARVGVSGLPILADDVEAETALVGAREGVAPGGGG